MHIVSTYLLFTFSDMFASLMDIFTLVTKVNAFLLVHRDTLYFKPIKTDKEKYERIERTYHEAKQATAVS